MQRLKLLVIAIVVLLAGVTFIHAQDVPVEPTQEVVIVTDPAPVVEVTAVPTNDTVKVPVPGSKEDNSGTVIVTYNAFSELFRIILVAVVSSTGLGIVAVVALILRNARQNAEVVAELKKSREKASPELEAVLTGLGAILGEISEFLKVTDPDSPPIEPQNPVG